MESHYCHHNVKDSAWPNAQHENASRNEVPARRLMDLCAETPSRVRDARDTQYQRASLFIQSVTEARPKPSSNPHSSCTHHILHKILHVVLTKA